MNKVVGSLLIGVVLSGNEIERIESIVNDVTKLRQNYEVCQDELNRLKTTTPVQQKHSLAALQDRPAQKLLSNPGQWPPCHGRIDHRKWNSPR